jgi:hypothetical protein
VRSRSGAVRSRTTRRDLRKSQTIVLSAVPTGMRVQRENVPERLSEDPSGGGKASQRNVLSCCRDACASTLVKPVSGARAGKSETAPRRLRPRNPNTAAAPGLAAPPALLARADGGKECGGERRAAAGFDAATGTTVAARSANGQARYIFPSGLNRTSGSHDFLLQGAT